MARGSHAVASTSNQYQHFIPKLILRNFSLPINKGKIDAVDPDSSRRKDIINVVDLDSGAIDKRPLKKMFGLTSMYRDDNSPEEGHVESKLGTLESKTGKIMKKICDAFESDPPQELSITREEKNTLRKFLFLMKYRNKGFFAKYCNKTLDDWPADEAQLMREHMQKQDLSCLRDVWLANLVAFMDADIDIRQSKWLDRLKRKAFAPDAMMFKLHVDMTHMVFCRPANDDEEFILTENAFGVFEGPNEIGSGLYTEWHNFAPLSPKVLILLRNNLLPDNVVQEREARQALYDQVRDMHLLPEAARSIFQDLPVQRPRNSYSSVVEGTESLNLDFKKISIEDEFFFTCHRLSTQYVDSINTVLLDQAASTQAITFRTTDVTARTLRRYLEHTIDSYVYHNSPQYCNNLRSAVAWLDPRPSKRLQRTPISIAYDGHWARWAGDRVRLELWLRSPALKNMYFTMVQDNCVSAFPYDVDQAARMAFLFVKCDFIATCWSFSKSKKQKVQRDLQDFFMTGPPQRWWLFCKIARNLDKLDPEDLSVQLSPLELAGPEDRAVVNLL